MPKQSEVEMSGGLQSKPSSTAAPNTSAAKKPSTSPNKPQKSSHLTVPSASPPTRHASPHPPATPFPSSNIQTDPPTRPLTLRPESPPSPSPKKEAPLTAPEADALCTHLCSLIWTMNLGHMYDKVLAADRPGQVSDKLYSQLLDFFYCFVPMVVQAPRSDPVVVRRGDLSVDRRILNTFGPGWDVSKEQGPNKAHRWFSRPKSSAAARAAGLLELLLGNRVMPKITMPLIGRNEGVPERARVGWRSRSRDRDGKGEGGKNGEASGGQSGEGRGKNNEPAADAKGKEKGNEREADTKSKNEASKK